MPEGVEPTASFLRRSCMRKNLILAILVAVVLAALVSPAAAHHRRPPAAKLVTGDTIQWGRLGTFCWSYSEAGSNEGTGMCADQFGYNWPRAKPATTGARARIQLKMPGCPSDGSLRWWSAVDRDKHPVGPGTRLDYRKRGIRRDGSVVACRLRFRLPDQVGHFYLDAFLGWDRSYRYPDGGTGGGGDAQYDFHLKLTEPNR